MKRFFLFSVFFVTAFAQQPKPAMTKDEALQRAAAYDAAFKMLGASGGVVGPQLASPPSQPQPVEKKGAKGKTKEEPLALVRSAPLPGNTRNALALTTAAFNVEPKTTALADGRVVYEYGAGIPPIVCALLQVNEIDLEPGEHATERDVDVGDDEFKISVHKGADRGGAFDYLIIKPTVADVETTLTVATDRRVYYFRLIATARDHIARIAFSYPDEDRLRQKTEAAALQAHAEDAAKFAALAGSKEIKNWKYSIDQHGRDSHYMLPLSVGDDGRRTYIQLSQDVRKLGLPTLSIMGATGEIPANSHWEENRLIVDALFDHGCLLQGVGKKQQRVCISNQGAK